MINYAKAFDQAVLSEEFLSDPYPHYANLRENNPVCWSERFNAWILTSYPDVRAALKHPQLISGKRVAAYANNLTPELNTEMQPLFYQVGKWIGNMDPPDHKRLRRMVDIAFTQKMVESLRPAIARLAQDLIGKNLGRGKMDFVQDFAYPLPAIVIAQMLGVPEEAREQFMHWSHSLTAYSGTGQAQPDLARSASIHAAELTDFFSKLASQRRLDPRDDLISRLVRLEMEGDALSTHELLSMCGFLIVAGHETTMGLLSNGLLALLRNPTQKEAWLKQPELGLTAVDELLRYDSPIQHQTRVAAEDIEFSGIRIKKDQRVMPFLGAANRDPDQFEGADRLNLLRSPNHHVAFGHGIHHCLGAPLARLEAQIAFPEIIRLLPNIRLESKKLKYRLHTSNRNPLELSILF